MPSPLSVLSPSPPPLASSRRFGPSDLQRGMTPAKRHVLRLHHSFSSQSVCRSRESVCVCKEACLFACLLALIQARLSVCVRCVRVWERVYREPSLSVPLAQSLGETT